MKPNRFAFMLDSPSITPVGQHYTKTFILHSTPLARGASDVLFFPPRKPWASTPACPRSVFLFLPGNPGLVGFYRDFLSTLSLSPSFPPNAAILCLAHLGHSPSLEPPETLVGLAGLVESELVVVDELLAIVGLEGKLGLGSHSMGSWVAVELLKLRPQIASLTLLFPTISHIVKSPNGQALWPLFIPAAQWFLPKLSFLLRLILPFTTLHPVSKSLIRSPSTIAAALYLSRDEMIMIKAADWDFLRKQKGKVFGYWGMKDGWVDEEEGRIAREILGGVQETGTEEEAEEESGVQRVWRCGDGIPHAFCLEHGELMAHKIAPWLRQTLG